MPTQAQFGLTLDSMVNFIDDRDFIGLRNYFPANQYEIGDCVVFANQVLQCNTATTGVFNPAHWTVLSAFGSVTYVSSWDTQNNAPPLQSSVGTKGFYYVVTNASPDPNLNTELNGIDDWATGDWAIFNGSVWQKVDNSQTPVAAENVSYVPSGDLTATNVQDALDELEVEKQPRIGVKNPAIPYALGGFQFGESSLKQQTDGIAIDLGRVIRSEQPNKARIDFGAAGAEVKLSTAANTSTESRLLLSSKVAQMFGEVVKIANNDAMSTLQLNDSGVLSLSNDGGTGTDFAVTLEPSKASMSHPIYGLVGINAGSDTFGRAVLKGADNTVVLTKSSVKISNTYGPGASVDLKSNGNIVIESDTLRIASNEIRIPALTASTVLVADATQHVVSSTVTSTELGYISGVAGPLQSQLNSKLSTGGGTMTGPIVLSGDPTAALEAATKQYVDAADSSIQTQVNNKVSKSGDSMTGLLTLSADPVAALGAVTKQYVDAIQTALSNGKVNKSGDTMTGALVLSADPTLSLGAATKQYVDVATKKILLPFSFNNDFTTNSPTFTSIALQVVIPDPATVFSGATTITAKLTIDFMCENGGTPAQGEAGLTEWTTPTTGSPVLIAGSNITMPATLGVWTKATSGLFTLTGNRSYRVIFRKTAGGGGQTPRIEAATLTLFFA